MHRDSELGLTGCKGYFVAKELVVPNGVLAEFRGSGPRKSGANSVKAE